jgi:hypothetical protein
MPVAFFEDFLRKIFKRQLLSTKNRPFGAVLSKRTTAGIFGLLPAPTAAGEWGSKQCMKILKGGFLDFLSLDVPSVPLVAGEVLYKIRKRCKEIMNGFVCFVKPKGTLLFYAPEKKNIPPTGQKSFHRLDSKFPPCYAIFDKKRNRG